jgi:hypothetical protein
LVARPWNKDVGRFEVAVDDAVKVGEVHRPCQNLHEPGAFVRAGRRRAEPGGQTPAVHELQRQERPAFVFADLEDLHDVGVLKARDRLGLAAKEGQGAIAGVRSGQDHLERDHSVQGEMTGLVDDAHAAAAQLAQDFVTGHDRQRGRRGVRRRGAQQLLRRPERRRFFSRRKILRRRGIVHADGSAF